MKSRLSWAKEISNCSTKFNIDAAEQNYFHESFFFFDFRDHYWKSDEFGKIYTAYRVDSDFPENQPVINAFKTIKKLWLNDGQKVRTNCGWMMDRR